MKTALYGRISTKDQNVETQKLVMKEYCLKNNFETIGEYIDEGISGAQGSRPQLDLMLADMRQGKFDVILTYKLDRLGRSLKNLIDLLCEFKNRRVRLISIMDNLDTANDNPMTKAFWQLLGVFAELEREIIRSRVMSGLERAKAEGKILGRKFGSKDKKQRRKSGYYLRYVGKKEVKNGEQGNN
jgi:DNA invertase Pin-like site-specific DNA recombinase